MAQYIDKSAVVAEIERRIEAHKETLKNCDSNISEIALKGSLSAYQSLLYFLNNTVEVKEVDLDKEIPSKELADEIDAISKRYPEISFAKLSRIAVRIAKWQKGQDELTASDKGMADEIIIHLKRIEEEYRLNLTKEIQWLRNITTKGE